MKPANETTPVEEVMTRIVLTVKPTDKMEDVAKIFEEHDINAAPVVDLSGGCIGIVTSHDLAEFESTRSEIENELKHGTYFDLARYGAERDPTWPIYFDRVDFNMTRLLVTAPPWIPLQRVARTMCEKHIHHVLVLDDQRRPIGMVSSLDILSCLTGSKVKRQQIL